MRLELIVEELETSLAANPAPADTAPAPSPRTPPVRKPLPATLPRETLVHAPACTCPDCGGALKQIGEDVAEQLEFIPEHFKVIRHVRPKFACSKCSTIVQMAAPSRPIDKGLAGPGLLAHVAVSKYLDHLPLYRQSEIYARQGIDLERSTLADWIGGISRLVTPLAELIADMSSLPAKFTPTTRRCRCSIRAGARPRPVGCGCTSGMIAPPGAARRRPRFIATRQRARARTRAPT